jgi:hypothetical protein
MTLTIAIEGTGVLDNAEGTTNWGIAGSGGVSISTNAETKIQGSYSVASKIAAGKYGWIYFDAGTSRGSPLDFTPSTGAQAGEHVYIWFNTTTPGFIDSYANYGLCVRMGTNASNYRSWIITCSDKRGNGYIGGWQCAVVDPTKTGSGTDTGTYNYATINYVGIFYYGNGSSVAQNIFVDTIAVGKGLRITGTDVNGWQDVSDYCTATPTTRVWGMMQEIQGIYFVYGKLFIGDTAQTAVTSMTDAGRVFRFGDWEYATSSSTYATSIGDGFNGLAVDDAGSYTTIYEETGSFFLGSKNCTTAFDLYGGNNSSSATTMNGVTWQRITDSFVWGNNDSHSATNCVWNNCAEIDFVGAVPIRSCTFKNYAGTDGAILWSSSIDVRECQFIDNNGVATSAAIRHTDGTPTTYYDLTFSGNNYDVFLDHATASLTISKDGTSNPTTYRSSGTGTVTFTGTKNLKITVKDASGTALTGARVLLEAASGGSDPYLATVTITSTGGVATVYHPSHGLTTDEMVNIRGAEQYQYNGAGKIITYVDADHYTYAVTGSPASPATGSITATQCYISDTTTSGVAENSYKYGTTQPARYVVRYSTTPPYYEDVTGSVSDISGGLDIPVQMGLDQ